MAVLLVLASSCHTSSAQDKHEPRLTTQTNDTIQHVEISPLTPRRLKFFEIIFVIDEERYTYNLRKKKKRKSWYKWDGYGCEIPPELLNEIKKTLEYEVPDDERTIIKR